MVKLVAGCAGFGGATGIVQSDDNPLTNGGRVRPSIGVFDVPGNSSRKKMGPARYWIHRSGFDPHSQDTTLRRNRNASLAWPHTPHYCRGGIFAGAEFQRRPGTISSYLSDIRFKRQGEVYRSAAEESVGAGI